jgi:hypothetical protein
MTPERWEQIERLYYAALERGAHERAAFLAGTCAGDDALRREVESLFDKPASTSVLRGFVGAAAARLTGERVSASAGTPAADQYPLPEPHVRLSQFAPLEDARFAPGRIFASRYRIVSLLGRGGMGEVYRAEDLRLGQSVALKLMSADIVRHEGVRRFVGEVRLARGITHPNVCRVYDIGDAEGWHYQSMDTSTEKRSNRCCGVSVGCLPRSRSTSRGNSARDSRRPTTAACSTAI